MNLTSDKIPNKMLLGSELGDIIVAECRSMIQKDCMFLKSIAYRRVAFTIQVTCHLGYPLPADHVVKSRVKADGVVEGEAPLVDLPDSESEVVALERDVVLDNPNIARIQHDLPIVVQERKLPTAMTGQSGIPGEVPNTVANPFPGIETHNLKYDKSQYPAGPEPVDRDVSDKKAAELGVKRRNR